MPQEKIVKLEIKITAKKQMSDKDFNNKILEQIGMLEHPLNFNNSLKYEIKWTNEDSFVYDDEEK